MTVTHFRMKIVAMFQFRDGRTAFVGPVEGQEGFLRACNCALVVNGQVRQVITVEGEMLPSPRHESGHRAVSSRDNVALVPEEIARQECFLQMVNAEA